MAWVRAVLWLRVCAGVVFLAGAADVVPLPPGLGREGVRKGCGGKPRGNPGAVGKGAPRGFPPPAVSRPSRPPLGGGWPGSGGENAGKGFASSPGWLPASAPAAGQAGVRSQAGLPVHSYS